MAATGNPISLSCGFLRNPTSALFRIGIVYQDIFIKFPLDHGLIIPHGSAKALIS